jgi:hypothetical protein
VPTNCQETLCDCPSEALNTDAAASWNTEVASYAAACRAAAGDGGLVACGVDCISVQPMCCGGACVAVGGVAGSSICPSSDDGGTDAATDAGPSDAGSDADAADGH